MMEHDTLPKKAHPPIAQRASEEPAGRQSVRRLNVSKLLRNHFHMIQNVDFTISTIKYL